MLQATITPALRIQAVRRILRAASILPAALLATACDDSDQDTHNPTIYDIVELASHADDATTFTLYNPDDNTPRLLTASARAATSVNPGECLFLSYTIKQATATTSESAYAANDAAADVTPIDVKAYAPILNTEARIVAAEEITGWDAEPVSLISMWLAGEKIILRCLLTNDPAPRHFSLLIDQATITDPVPQAYLCHRREDPYPNYTTQYYTAFSLAPLLHPETTTTTGTTPHSAITVHINNSADPSLSTITLPL